MDGNSEIVDIDRGVNGSIGSFEKTYPPFSILDPELTYNIPYSLTLYHGVTILVQAMEQYVCNTTDTPIQDGFTESILKTVLAALKCLKNDLHDKNARAQLMWASALTTSRILGRGKKALWLGGALGGIIEEKCGLTYSQSIAITWPKYLLTCYQDYVGILKSFALNVMNVDPENKSCDQIAYEGVKAFQETLLELGIANNVEELGLKKYCVNDLEKQIKQADLENLISKQDIETIIRLSLGG